jgi:hypothetical protein
MTMRLVLLVAIVCCMVCLGCSNGTGLYPVKGKVLYKGQPAVGAEVYFHRRDVGDRFQEQTPQGIVQEDGTFELTGPVGKGAMPGNYVVLVEWKEGSGKVRGRSPGITAPDRLKGRYFNPNKPLLQTEVKSTTNDLPAFELN